MGCKKLLWGLPTKIGRPRSWECTYGETQHGNEYCQLRVGSRVTSRLIGIDKLARSYDVTIKQILQKLDILFN